jgi:hypothetical protein
MEKRRSAQGRRLERAGGSPPDTVPFIFFFDSAP